MNAARLLQIIASLATLVAMALGMGTYTYADFTSIICSLVFLLPSHC